MDVALQRLRLGRDGRSQMLTGLRGVGKTVMLNEFEQLAGGRGYFHEHVEVGEDGDLTPRLAAAFRRVLLSMDARRRIGERVRRALGVLKAFSIRLPDGAELSIDVDAVSGPADSGDLATDLSGLFVELGEVARDHGTGRPDHHRRAALRGAAHPRGARDGPAPRRPAAPADHHRRSRAAITGHPDRRGQVLRRADVHLPGHRLAPARPGPRSPRRARRRRGGHLGGGRPRPGH